MDGFGSHTFQWVNAQGERVWVKFHFKTDQGIKNLTSEDAARIGGQDPQHHLHDLYQAIERGEHPSWTLKVQIMTEEQAATYRWNPFDLTKIWSQKDFPLIEIGKLVLDRTPRNFFADTEQSAFDPGHFVPGIGPSPDRMLQARLFAYGDAARYRLGVNHTELPINTPHAVPGGARNYGRDGYMRGGDNGGASKNYEPNSYGGPVQTGEPLYNGVDVSGRTDAYVEGLHAEDDDFVQAGNLYRLMPADAKTRLIENIAGSLAQVTREDVISRSIEHFQKRGRRLRRALDRGRARPPRRALRRDRDETEEDPMNAHVTEPAALTDDAADALAILRRAFQHARVGEVAEILALLDAGVPVDLQNEKGDTLLMLSAYHGHHVAVAALLERGAAADRPNDRRQTPLAGAAFKGDRRMVEILLDGGAAVDGHGGDGKTALMFAAMFDQLEVIELLLARGAAPDRADASGLTALALARAMGAQRAIARLSERA